MPEVQQQPARPQERVSGRELMEQYLRHWTPLNEALPTHEAKQFAWERESGTMQIYKHMQTGQHLYIDGQDGQFLDRDREPITAKEALDFAMPDGQQHSHSLDREPEREISIHRGYGFGIGM